MTRRARIVGGTVAAAGVVALLTILYILEPGGGSAYLRAARERLRIWRLDRMRETKFPTWGRYEGEGIELRG